MTNIIASTEPRAIVHRRVGGVALRVPFTVEGEEGYVQIGVQAADIPTHMFDGPTGAARLRVAIGKALTDPILTKYGKGLVEKQKLADTITDVIITHARNTL